MQDILKVMSFVVQTSLYVTLHYICTYYTPVTIYENCPIAYYKLHIGKTIQHKNSWELLGPHIKYGLARGSAIAEGPRNASCQLKSCQLPRNSAETTYTTSPHQIDGMKLEI